MTQQAAPSIPALRAPWSYAPPIMCGRFALYSTPARIAASFGAEAGAVSWSARYNVGPQQLVPVLRRIEGRRRLDLLRWGLVPSWAERPDIGARLFNARSETAPDKPAFRSAFRHRRCVVAVDGFYEWKRLPDGTRQPYFISRADTGLLALAGLWEHWTGADGRRLETFTILTMPADAWMQPLHERMPVMLDTPAALATWLDETSPRQGLDALPGPLPPASLRAWPVTRAVGQVRNDSPELVRPLPDSPDSPDSPEIKADSPCA